MSIQEMWASECDVCGGYSNQGFDLCESCAFDFTYWLITAAEVSIKKREDVDKAYEKWQKQREG